MAINPTVSKMGQYVTWNCNLNLGCGSTIKLQGQEDLWHKLWCSVGPLTHILKTTVFLLLENCSTPSPPAKFLKSSNLLCHISSMSSLATEVSFVPCSCGGRQICSGRVKLGRFSCPGGLCQHFVSLLELLVAALAVQKATVHKGIYPTDPC